MVNLIKLNNKSTSHHYAELKLKVMWRSWYNGIVSRFGIHSTIIH